MISRSLNQKIVKDLLFYLPMKGIFIWRERPIIYCDSKGSQSAWNKKFAGKLAGDLGARYWRIRVFGRAYQAHRLAWIYVYGAWPKNEIDHINRINLDNRIENLRDVTRKENLDNRAPYCQRRLNSSNKSGCTGVSWDKRLRKWRATITTNKETKELGRFKDLEIAIKARKEAEIYYFKGN